MNATMLNTHVRSELVLHRWDLVGDDDESLQLLAQPELTSHAVKALNAFATLDEAPGRRARRAGLAPDARSGFGLRCDDEPDVLVSINHGTAEFSLSDDRASRPPGTCIRPHDSSCSGDDVPPGLTAGTARCRRNNSSSPSDSC